jgi:hypothetical protein
MITTFETAVVGDKVWSIDSGWGEIRARHGSVTYPLGVYFSNGEYRTYTLGGLYTEYDKTQSLFWDEVKTVAPQKPTPEVAKLVEALEEIIHPVRFMQERLEEGEQLNGMVAVQLAEDAEYLRDIAIAALTTYRDQGGE